MAKKPVSKKSTAAKPKTSARKVNHAEKRVTRASAAKVKATKSKATKSKATKSKATESKAARARATRIQATPADLSDKAHLVNVIQNGTGASTKAAKDTLDKLIETITHSLKRNQKVQLLGFGTFHVVKRPARRGRNFATGKPMRIKASKGIRFKPGTKLKATI